MLKYYALVIFLLLNEPTSTQLNTSLKNSIPLNSREFEDTLIHFTTVITGLNNEEDLYWSIAKDCISRLGLEDCVIYAVDKDHQKLVQKAAFGPKNPKDHEIYEPVSIAIGEGISGFVVQSGVPEIIQDTSQDPRYIVDDARRYSEMAVPIINEGEIYGVIDCEHSQKNYFTEQHLHLLSTVATICGIKIKQLRSLKNVEEQQRQLLEAKNELMEIKLKAFQAHMNPHFVFNSLNAIQYFITSDDKERALHYISTFSKLIRYYLQNFNVENLSLKEEMGMLDNYLKLQKLRYANQLTYDKEIIGAYPPSEVLIPAFLLQTLFENLIEHAIYNRYRDFHLSMKFYPSTEEVVILVEFSYTVIGQGNVRPMPEYREQIIQWQDQIRLLNQYKKYTIKKKVRFNREGKKLGGSVHLKLPNLN